MQSKKSNHQKTPKHKIPVARNWHTGTFEPLIVIAIFIIVGVGAIVWTHIENSKNSGPITGLAGTCLNNANSSAIDLWTCNGSKAQDWTVETNKSLEVQGHCLTVKNAEITSGTSVTLYPCDNTAAQTWVANSNDELINPRSKLCLSVNSNTATDGTSVLLETCVDSASQVWTLPKPLVKISASTPTISPKLPNDTSSARPTIVGHVLEAGNSGARLKMHGVAVWGIEDQITGTFGVNEYNNRQTIINTIKSWGGNEIRLRVLASNYNSQTYMSQAKELQEIKDWQTAAQAAGIYLSVAWWDSLDGTYSGAHWATDYSQAFPMMSAVIDALGATNPWVFYEPFNEPHNVSTNQWLSAMEATDTLFRSDGYTGILLFDTNDYSHEYNDSAMTQLENYDAVQAGMNNTNQVIFAKHDYANEYPNSSSGFDAAYWPKNDFGTSTWNFTKHLVWETEFGNYNGSLSTISYPWSAGAAAWMAQQVNNGTLVGATAFVFGPWYDANAMTGSNYTTPTRWGGYVKNDFLKATL